MGLQKYSIYKYVRTARGWRYCKPAVAPNHKIKPDIVLVNKVEERHPEGAYYLNVCGKWVLAGKSAAEAHEERARRLAKQEYERLMGKGPSPGAKPGDNRKPLQGAVESYLSELEFKVRAKIRRPKTYAACQNALREFVRQCGVKYLAEVSASTIAKYMQWCVEHSPSQSSRTAHNKFLLVLQFLKHCDAVPVVGTGKSARKLCMKDAPRYVEKPISIYEPEDLARFFFACDARETAIFQTFFMAGLREQELATLRRQDCKLDGPAPCLKVVERPEYGFTPKAYEIRDVSIPPGLASLLKGWLGTHDHDLVFPPRVQRGKVGKPSRRVDGHILRLCKRVAKRAGLDPDRAWLHKFRSTYATLCLRKGMDLETLRAQLGHRDTESVRRYLVALKDEQRARKVAEVFSGTAGAAEGNTLAAGALM